MDNQEERTVTVTDGAYSGTENAQLAANKNVELTCGIRINPTDRFEKRPEQISPSRSVFTFSKLYAALIQRVLKSLHYLPLIPLPEPTN